MKLTDRFEDILEYKSYELHLDLSFDNVLRIFELVDEEDMNDDIKIDIMFAMLVYDSDDYDLSLEEKGEIVNHIVENILELNGGKDSIGVSETTSLDGEITDEKYFDLEEDAEYIYASFLQDYGIDLYEQQGRLHWFKFLALLSGLTENTKFREVVRIRTEPLPKNTPENREARNNLKKLKQQYALKKQKQISVDEQMSAIAQQLKLNVNIKKH